ncbi:CRISPR-associated protein Csx19 [Streptomyces sp900105755]|uniref:CRISPR-associated protein Csx19 n=1 Tax=Streptomyces sp. 900105755 TaxID=3154389 RepID=A0ABV1TWM0_9ACTN
MTTLHARAEPGITLADALARAGFTDAVALLSSPHEHIVARVRDGHCHTNTTPAVYGLDTVFEARIFNEHRELRWLCKSGTRGRAVILTEDPDLLPDAFTHDIAPVAAVDTLDAHYLLWGRPVSGDSDWTMLHTPQIGTIEVPFPAPDPDRRLRLAAREYVSVEPQHGNAYVSEERLLRIECTPSAQAGSTHG